MIANPADKRPIFVGGVSHYAKAARRTVNESPPLSVAGWRPDAGARSELVKEAWEEDPWSKIRCRWLS